MAATDPATTDPGTGAAEDVAATSTPDDTTGAPSTSDDAETSGRTDTGQPAATDEDAADDEPDTFPRAAVEKLRAENAKYRQRARQADTLAERLHTEIVRATGRLADPTDLPFDQANLDDPDTLTAAIDQLLDQKPHLATRRPAGDIGQGQRGPASGGFSLLGLLKERT